jgi:two-component system, chemotaxis family, CheB/CheR fusion protein
MPVELARGSPPRLIAPAAGAPRPRLNIPALADRKVLELYGPPGVVIDEHLDVVYIRGQVSPFLQAMPGAPSFNVLRLAPPELHVDLRRGIHEALTTNAKVSISCHLTTADAVLQFGLEVRPLIDPELRGRHLLVLFTGAKPEPLTALPSPAAQEQRLQQPEGMRDLERELAVTKDFLQSTVEELESSNEELSSTIEEMQSSNEELQSTNEELESSKEELQSSNEELTTSNDELQERMGELQQSNDDLHNVMAGIGIAVVIVGMDLRIRRYTQAAGKLLNLIEGDIGRSVGQLNSFVGGDRVEDLAAEVIASLIPIEREVVGSDRRWYDLVIAPYKTLDHAINGAVISLSDIQTRKRTPNLARDVAQYASGFLGLIKHPLVIADAKLQMVWANDSFHAAFGRGAREEGMPIVDIFGRQALEGTLKDQLRRVIATGAPVRDVSLRIFPQEAAPVQVVLTASRVPPLGSGSTLILLSLELVQ